MGLVECVCSVPANPETYVASSPNVRSVTFQSFRSHVNRTSTLYSRFVVDGQEGFRLLCARMQVNEYLLALEKAAVAEEAEDNFRDMEIRCGHRNVVTLFFLVRLGLLWCPAS